ncbi:uncharacterized protein LOC134235014 isoform X2 [Saccostrea cucullata]|uniref:uncharacterized protein LOC134235014 isoform X2 n=1 Tax=Saccostrea cuccullata TaxID=36930 RepID=UPI002ED564B3
MIYSTNLRGVFAYTGGPSFAGPFQGYYPNADVRVRVWRMCDFPPANFTSAGEYTVSTSDASITSIPHHIGYYPDFVVVQLKLSNGYISEAQGTVFKEVGEVSHNAVCGVIMAYNILDIRLWPATEGVGRVGVFCVSDGWGGNEFYTAATVYIQAWKFPPSDILFSQTDTRGPGIMVPSTLLMPQPFSIETNIFLVQSQALEGNNANYLFEAAGSALSDGSTFFGRIGAVVYAYNSEEFNLWYPGTGDFLIYVGGTWGKGDMSQSSSTASVKVKVIKTDSPLPGCGCAVCTSDWNTLTTTCDLAGPCITSTTVVYNITTVQQRIQELRNNLTVDTKNTSSYRRSLTCADDSRPSAAQIGYLGIGILCLTGGLVLCADLTSLAKIHEDDD